MIEESRLVEVAQKLVRAKSENPPGEEYESAMIVKEEMEKIGLDVSVYEFEAGRPNVVGVLKGDNSTGTSLLLSPHTDVVPAGAGWTHSPYGAEIMDGKIYGRGASDCKGNVAVCLEVARSIIEDRKNLKGDLIIAATADEEAGSKKGIIPLLEKGTLRPTAAVAVDGGDFKILVAQKGLIHITVKILGKKAHGAYPEKGVNAIEIAAKAITDLKKHKFSDKHPPVFRSGVTLNVGKIFGGEKVNVVADACAFELDVRFAPGTKSKDILKQIGSVIKKHAKKYTIDIDAEQEPYELRAGSSIQENLKKASMMNKKTPQITGSSGATIMSEFEKYGIPSIATGFGVADAMHATDEYVFIKDLVLGARILEDFVLMEIGK